MWQTMEGHNGLRRGVPQWPYEHSILQGRSNAIDVLATAMKATWKHPLHAHNVHGHVHSLIYNTLSPF